MLLVTAHVHPVISAPRRAALGRRVRFLVAFTIAYNVIEAAVALVTGSVADSSALIGFGLDSLIEVLSAAAVAWQFAGPRPAERERTALRVIAVSFFGLAAFVGVDATSAIVAGSAPEHAPAGIVLAAASLAIMPTVSLIQRRTGRELGSHSVMADAKQTLLCAAMSAVLLVGLVARSALDWWWADAVAALVIAGLAVREGVSAWRGDACCSAEALFDGVGEQHAGADGHDSEECAAGCRCD